MKKKRVLTLPRRVIDMRVWMLVTLLVLAHPFALFSQENEKTITIEKHGIKVKEALDMVRSQSGYYVMYAESIIDKDLKINLSLKNATVAQAVEAICSQSGLVYEFKGNNIITINKPEVSKERIRISGVVKDSNGEPLPGVIVNLAGSTYSGSTNMNGEFLLRVAPQTKHTGELMFSLLGMKNQSVKFQEGKEYVVMMEESDQSLNEVIVTGYQNMDRRDMVGSYTTLKAEDILMPAYTSIDQMLQGRVAGLIVSNTSTRVGSAPKITLRGTSTLLGTSSPLWVVDGIIQQDMSGYSSNSTMLSGSENDLTQYIGSVISWLNPNDIENITVLKDASATAIYGSRASNGVIVITTKKGREGRLSVSYSANMTVGIRPTYDNYYVMNSKERINFSKEAYDAGAYYYRTPVAQMHTYEGLMRLYLNNEISEQDFIDRYKYLETVNTDWLDILTRTTFSHQHNVSVSGGSSKFSYNASLNYKNTQGTEIGNDQENMSGRMRIGIEPSSRLSIDLNLTGTVSETNGFTAGVNPQSYAISTSRAIPAYDSNGDYLFYKRNDNPYLLNENGTKEYGLGYNILNERDYSYKKLKTPQINANLDVKFDIIKNVLKYNLVAGYINQSRRTEDYADEKTYYIAQNYRGYDYGTKDSDTPEFKAAYMPFGGKLIHDDARTWSYNIQNKLSYYTTIDEKHRISAMGAWEVSSATTSQISNTIYGYLKYKGEIIVTPPAPGEIVPIQGSANTWGVLNSYFGKEAGTRNYTNNMLSGFLSLAYSYDHKYVFNFSMRNDVSNRFGQDQNKRFDPTFSFGGSWRVSDEKFMEGIKPYISTLGVKATYGLQGNALTRISPDLILLKPRLSDIYYQYYTSITQLPNPNLKWERTKTWNTTFEFGMFDDKILFVVDGYGRNSSPVSNSQLLPEYGASNNIPQNVAKIDNKGIEVTASFSPIKTKDMKLAMTLIYSKNWNNVKQAGYNENMKPSTTNFLSGNITTDGQLLREGYPVNGFWGYALDGLDPTNGYPQFKYMDMTDYESQADFLTYIGEKESYMTAGINLNFSYKSFSLASNLAANIGGKQFLPNPYDKFISSRIPFSEVNLSKELNDRWRKPGDEAYTTIPGVYTGGNPNTTDPSGQNRNIYAMWTQSDARVASSSFLRCRQISANWYVSPNLTQRFGVQRLTLSATVSNIFVIADSKFKGMDPETGTSVLPRSLSFGLNASF